MKRSPALPAVILTWLAAVALMAMPVPTRADTGCLVPAVYPAGHTDFIVRGHVAERDGVAWIVDVDEVLAGSAPTRYRWDMDNLSGCGGDMWPTHLGEHVIIAVPKDGPYHTTATVIWRSDRSQVIWGVRDGRVFRKAAYYGDYEELGWPRTEPAPTLAAFLRRLASVRGLPETTPAYPTPNRHGPEWPLGLLLAGALGFALASWRVKAKLGEARHGMQERI